MTQTEVPPRLIDMVRLIQLLLLIALASPGVPSVHSHSTEADHEPEAHETETLVLCHTTPGDPREASGDHVHQCGVPTAILAGSDLAASIPDHGMYRVDRTRPYTSPAFAPPERPPNRVT